ncbi:endonuclease domain-containing protein [Arthrobacter sp. FW306-2-2C-D06B]|uniref:endonuclease domain-containing protein n=1 Tax=Arthrobacter sp. FW306-2-2C-D06B TaxID=2879618 RepID=UPI001F2C0D42|nr:endonuclease domain-containing protein [Arthrobacter sp. FW306-2-2C-D06B]UKA58449.1 endonuclease domain-containing protein [Arthrobacter sp. FW306-2-2C-D06B]
MRSPGPLPETLRGRSFTLSEQRAAGVSDNRAWNKDLRVASRGVGVPWGAAQELAHTARLLTGISPGTVCCGPTAAILWRCPLPFDLERQPLVHLLRWDGGNRPVRKGVAGRRVALGAADRQALDGVPVTSPARTWLDLAALLPLDDLVAAADHFICTQSRSFGHNRAALCSLEDLRSQVEGNPGIRGRRNALLALELARVGADSVPETKLRLAIGRRGLPEPVLRFVVRDSAGWELAWPDLAFPRYKVAVNYDGSHHLTATQKESDIRRDESIAAIGWTSVTITARHVKAWGFDGVVHRVRDALARAGWASET